ncbi:MAG: ATP-binding cassette domain-containing protein [Gemmatimonadaceae bacterium]|jgi:ABC-2 type transport system ATP-binding protein|nr:ATP-binding cassette domain-containing protein [Gemmatimonadaceae bacterium]
MLTVSRVHRRYATVHAVNDLSFHVDEGEIFALLGPNGAGKSTLLRMLVGITRPDSGTIAWRSGRDTVDRLPAGEIGYLPEERGLYQDQPMLAVLEYFGMLRGMHRADARRAATAWLERLELGERRAEKVGSLSKGNQQKVQFAAAVLHRPRFVILDEPFSGLDPLNQEVFLALVRELRDAGTTVLFSAHQMSLVERLADRLFVMQHGREVLSGTIPAVRDRWGGGRRVLLHVEQADDAALASIRTLPAVLAVTRQDDGAIAITVAADAPIGPLLAQCATRVAIVDVRTEQPSLHDVYITTVGAATVAAEAA